MDQPFVLNNYVGTAELPRNDPTAESPTSEIYIAGYGGQEVHAHTPFTLTSERLCYTKYSQIGALHSPPLSSVYSRRSQI